MGRDHTSLLARSNGVRRYAGAVRDLDIRAALRAHLDARHANDPDTLIRNELGVCLGESRVDLAVINSKIAGYEIKSERDTLARLAREVEFYSRVVDEAWIVSSARHAFCVAQHVPKWWGVMDAQLKDGNLVLGVRRGARCNPKVDPYAVAQLVWRDEAFALLERYGAAAGMRRATRFRLWEALAENLLTATLAAEVRAILKARQQWSGG